MILRTISYHWHPQRVGRGAMFVSIMRSMHSLLFLAVDHTRCMQERYVPAHNVSTGLCEVRGSTQQVVFMWLGHEKKSSWQLKFGKTKGLPAKHRTGLETGYKPSWTSWWFPTVAQHDAPAVCLSSRDTHVSHRHCKLGPHPGGPGASIYLAVVVSINAGLRSNILVTSWD
jgi:hypothetical protein